MWEVKQNLEISLEKYDILLHYKDEDHVNARNFSPPVSLKALKAFLTMKSQKFKYCFIVLKPRNFIT